MIWLAEYGRSQKERNWLIQQLQNFAKVKRIRVSFLSGDVHCAAVGVLKTLSKGKSKKEVLPPVDFRYMVNIVSSKISTLFCENVLFTCVPRCDCKHPVSPPKSFQTLIMALRRKSRPPAGVIAMVSTLATKNHRTMHHAETDESMVLEFRL
jgi:hypothetical protein